MLNNLPERLALIRIAVLLRPMPRRVIEMSATVLWTTAKNNLLIPKRQRHLSRPHAALRRVVLHVPANVNIRRVLVGVQKLRPPQCVKFSQGVPIDQVLRMFACPMLYRLGIVHAYVINRHHLMGDASRLSIIIPNTAPPTKYDYRSVVFAKVGRRFPAAPDSSVLPHLPIRQSP